MTRRAVTCAIIGAILLVSVASPFLIAWLFGEAVFSAFPFGLVTVAGYLGIVVVFLWRNRPVRTFAGLAPQDLRSAEFRSRLHDAADLDDLALDRIIAAELPHLRNVGIYLDGHFVGFASYATTEAGTELEYIAIDPVMRGKRLGQALIASIPKPIHATTDDDAIGFYRALGFDTEPIAPDPRWPDRQRYSCTLAALAPAPLTPA